LENPPFSPENIPGVVFFGIALYKLQSTSQCIDRGIDVGLPYIGNAPDPGAFEYGMTDGIKNVSLAEAAMIVYPNPIKTNAVFSIQPEKAEKVKIRLFDVKGVCVAVIADDYLNEGTSTIAFNRGSLPSGVYFYTVQYDNQKFGRHLIIN
jgi:hypothetical protein